LPRTNALAYSSAPSATRKQRFYKNLRQDLIEVWDEAKRLRCEWYNDYEKGVTKPPIRVSDLEVVELNFRGEILNWVPGL
jgi:hypothetical protein